MFGRKDSSGNNCWFCQRKIKTEDIYLTSTQMQTIFDEVFDDLKPSGSLQNSCVCNICMAIMKFTAQDSVAAKIKLSHASDSIKGKASILKTKFKEKAGELKEKADIIREEQS